ncbi:phosphate-starvation-inducible PsiE family protein [Calothrix sp. UHCC 0171]|uniref:phosphate-starvation-inducible PsiE family protein n=1 Tax=Calothrix sp. UHCC 0171 TaxID=3110245 RepID=UPI002B208039|nr:phosphate-starvation-inducible PsiE family protein [Calothrix sp. UHCC 0171]MEA5570578.1 phosphate-starvation-inducible PsiE family protein [Calothrix sp. UHCC 0171]
MRRLFKTFRELTTDENFIHIIENIEVVVAKILSFCMLFVILAAIGDLIIFMFRELLSFGNYGNFYKTLFKVFGLFLNVLIALEILENITGYLKKHVLQVELVIVTSLIAVARKIIILDLDKVSGIDIIGLGIAVLSLSVSYLIIRSSNSKTK